MGRLEDIAIEVSVGIVVWTVVGFAIGIYGIFVGVGGGYFIVSILLLGDRIAPAQALAISPAEKGATATSRSGAARAA